MEKWIEDIIDDKCELINKIKNSGYLNVVQNVGNIICNALRNGNKILLAGNGGSAADAQHFAGEIVGRFLTERNAYPAISLCTDPTVVTCIANDYGYNKVFARQIEGIGIAGDVFIAISTSGNSGNLIDAIDVAKSKGLIVVGLLGKDGGKMKDLCDYSMVVPSNSTPRIQEIHTFTVHILCEIVDKNFA